MGGTSLKRKARRNKTRAKVRKQIMKIQGFKPVIRRIDIEAIKESFAKRPSKGPGKADQKGTKEEIAASHPEVIAEKKAVKSPAKSTGRKTSASARTDPKDTSNKESGTAKPKDKLPVGAKAQAKPEGRTASSKAKKTSPGTKAKGDSGSK